MLSISNYPMKYFTVSLIVVCASFSAFSRSLNTPSTVKPVVRVTDSIMGNIGSTPNLLSCRTAEIDSNGYANTWEITYTTKDSSYVFVKDSTDIRYTSKFGIMVGALFITGNWLNSDSAVRIAETNCGAAFRKNHPGCIMSASLGGPMIPNAFLKWTILYKATDSTKSIAIDATNGSVDINNFTPKQCNGITFRSTQNNENLFIAVFSGKMVKGQITLYRSNGSAIRILHQGTIPSGHFSIQVSKTGLSSGIYIIRCESPETAAALCVPLF